jgi:hypothetical protein
MDSKKTKQTKQTARYLLVKALPWYVNDSYHQLVDEFLCRSGILEKKYALTRLVADYLPIYLDCNLTRYRRGDSSLIFVANLRFSLSPFEDETDIGFKRACVVFPAETGGDSFYLLDENSDTEAIPRETDSFLDTICPLVLTVLKN